MKPLVSIITPTFKRHDTLLNRTIPSIQKQTYPNIEHIIISDCQDPELAEKLKSPNFYQLGRNWGGFIRGEGTLGVGSIPRNVGVCLARGDYIGYLDDDDEFLPNHVELLVNTIEQNNVDFAFSRMNQIREGNVVSVIGDGTIQYGHVGTPMLLHKVDCFKKAQWVSLGYDEDFRFYQQLIDATYTYRFVNEVTVNAYLR